MATVMPHFEIFGLEVLPLWVFKIENTDFERNDDRKIFFFLYGLKDWGHISGIQESVIAWVCVLGELATDYEKSEKGCFVTK